MQSLDWGMILGGFGLFMFGIKFMGDGLKAVAGDKLKDYINRYTSNTVSAMLIGIVITIIMQSSSATSAWMTMQRTECFSLSFSAKENAFSCEEK